MMRVLCVGTIVLLFIVMALTLVAAGLANDAHERLIQRLESTGLLTQTRSSLTAGWLQSQSSGELLFASKICGSCGSLQYQGDVLQGLGAWLNGKLNLLHLSYQLELPDFPLQPDLPSVLLQAQRTLGPLSTRVALPGSAHDFAGALHRYHIRHAGLHGVLNEQALQLQDNEVLVSRGQQSWLKLRGFKLKLLAEDGLRIEASSERCVIPAWHWQGDDVVMRYQHASNDGLLDLTFEMDLMAGQLVEQARHGPSQAKVSLSRLDWSNTRAFVGALYAKIAAAPSQGELAGGLMRVYADYGPDFFASLPRMRVQTSALPLSTGFADINIDLAVRPGMQELPLEWSEWQQALQGEVDIVAPRGHLKLWWQGSGRIISLILGLPQDYASLLSEGWVQVQPDGRDRLKLTMSQTSTP